MRHYSLFFFLGTTQFFSSVENELIHDYGGQVNQKKENAQKYLSSFFKSFNRKADKTKTKKNVLVPSIIHEYIKCPKKTKKSKFILWIKRLKKNKEKKKKIIKPGVLHEYVKKLKQKSTAGKKIF